MTHPEPTQPTSFTPDNPFRLVLLFPPMGDQAPVLDALVVNPAVQVDVVPYMESAEARTHRGGNDGKLGADWSGELPELDQAALALLAQAHGLVMLDKPDNIAELAPNLLWAQSIGAGYDHIDLDDLRKLPLVYTNASGVASVPIAEFVMARLLEVWKSLRQIETQQAAGVWEPAFGRTVQGMTMGVVGLGAIGREVAIRARAFGMTVLASRGSAKPGDTDPDVDVLFPADDLNSMLSQCDAVVVAAPATPATLDLFDAERFSAMQPGAVFCNVARGTLAVEQDIVDALVSGHLGAAILDVTREEPLPDGHALWTAPNCYISPHSAPALDRYQETLFALAAKNLGFVLAATPLKNTIFDQRNGQS